MANLLDICTRALNEISSLNVPTFIVGNSDDIATQLHALARKVGDELIRDYDWQELARTATVTTVDAVSLYDLEDDYDRIASDTMWDATQHRRMLGNTTKRQWAAITNYRIHTQLRYRWRLYRNQIQIEPAANGVFLFDYEYLSKAYCTSSGGMDRTDGWADDTDIPVLPADLFIHGILYYFQKSNNLPYGDAEAEYDAVIQSRQGKNTPSAAVDMGAGICVPSRRGLDRLSLNIPDVIDV